MECRFFEEVLEIRKAKQRAMTAVRCRVSIIWNQTMAFRHRVQVSMWFTCMTPCSIHFFVARNIISLPLRFFLQRFCLAMRLDSTQLRFHPNNVIQRPVPVSYTSTLKDVQACHRLVPARQWFASCGRKAWDGWMIQTGLSACSGKALESLQTWRGCPVLPFSEIVFLIVPQPWIGPRCLQPFFFLGSSRRAKVYLELVSPCTSRYG